MQTAEGMATIEIRSAVEEDVHKALEDFKSCERLANIKRDLVLMDHIGKKVYALHKIQGNLPSAGES